MKKTLISILLLVPFFSSLLAEDIIKPADSKIVQVTVFRSGAQVSRVAGVALPAGNVTVMFADLPERLNPSSIQVNGTGRFTILSVAHQVNYLRTREKSRDLIELEKKLEDLKNRLGVEEGMLAVYQSEESMILANKTIGGTQSGLDVARLKETADFFRLRLTELSSKKLEVNNRINKLKEEIQKIMNQINSGEVAKNRPTSEILVNLAVPSAVQAEFDLRYFVNEAGWYPGYDIRAEDITKPVEMHYKANVYQSSGEEWKNVKVTLSTGNPKLSGMKPELMPWYLRFYEPPRTMYLNEAAGTVKKAAAQPAVARDIEEVSAEAAVTAAELTTVSEGQTNVEFSIGIPCTIPTDGKSQAVEIQTFSVPATYEYHAVPKLDMDAFLMARITGWEEFNLLPGEMNLFFEGTYVGKSFLDVVTSDTLSLSLGRDKSIVIERKALKDYTRRQTLGTKKSESRGFEIEVRNTRKSNIRLILQDQFPVSTNKDIEVERNEYSGGKIDNSGIVRWAMDLKPAESRKIRLSYTVKYPKDQTIILD